jgi:hypothetical protein
VATGSEMAKIEDEDGYAGINFSEMQLWFKFSNK